MVKNLPANAGDAEDSGSIPGLGRFPGGGNGNPLQYSCLENPVDRGAWRTAVHGAKRFGHDWASMHKQGLTKGYPLAKVKGVRIAKNEIKFYFLKVGLFEWALCEMVTSLLPDYIMR